ncbi:MAG: LytTR family transcriptional regulator [Lachnospiraceae bacterium]|nr:LytTR family transcriptional regulator [Lachnospiraceae bacterium]
MKVTVNVDEKNEETKVIICCQKMTPTIENIIVMLQMFNQQLSVTKDGENYLLDVNQISYIETLERKTFVYTEESIYESNLRLYEMEEQLCQSGFLRVSKSCLVHLKFIQSIKKDIERKLRLTMKNGEQIMVSRQYADGIKKRLGVI